MADLAALTHHPAGPGRLARDVNLGARGQGDEDAGLAGTWLAKRRWVSLVSRMPTNNPISMIITEALTEYPIHRVVGAAVQPVLIPAVHPGRCDQQVVQRRQGEEDSHRRAVTGKARSLLATSM